MGARLAGLDVGDKRIGVAVSDGIGLTAQGIGVVERRSKNADVEAILSLLGDYQIGGFVAGLPLLLDGTEGDQVDRVRHFCGHLEAATGLPVHYMDERLSSAEAERLMLTAGLRREKRRKSRDMIAATLILQGYMDTNPDASTAG